MTTPQQPPALALRIRTVIALKRTVGVIAQGGTRDAYLDAERRLEAAQVALRDCCARLGVSFPRECY